MLVMSNLGYYFICNCAILWDKSLVNRGRNWEVTENGCWWTRLSTLEKWLHKTLYRLKRKRKSRISCIHPQTHNCTSPIQNFSCTALKLSKVYQKRAAMFMSKKLLWELPRALTQCHLKRIWVTQSFKINTKWELLLWCSGNESD